MVQCVYVLYTYLVCIRAYTVRKIFNQSINQSVISSYCEVCMEPRRPGQYLSQRYNQYA